MSFVVAFVVAAVLAVVVLGVIGPWLRRRRQAETSHYDAMRGPDPFDPTTDAVRDPEVPDRDPSEEDGPER